MPTARRSGSGPDAAAAGLRPGAAMGAPPSVEIEDAGDASGVRTRGPPEGTARLGAALMDASVARAHLRAERYATCCCMSAGDEPIRFEDSAECPCGGGKTVEACTCRARLFVPLPVNTNPHRITSGIRMAKCYARDTGNCRPPISAEHAMTEAVWKDFGTPMRRTLRDGSTVEVPPGTAGRKILCTGHNNDLSPLDQVGVRFMRAVKDGFLHQVENRPSDTHVLFNGYDVERWLLKVLCGSAHDQPISRVTPSPKWSVPKSWVDIVFGGASFPEGTGIFVPRVERGRFAQGITTAKIVSRRDAPGIPLVGMQSTNVAGLATCFYGQDFDLHMIRPTDADTNWWYRVRMLRSRSRAGGVHHIHLGWDAQPPTFAGKVAPADRVNVLDELLLRVVT